MKIAASLLLPSAAMAFTSSDVRGAKPATSLFMSDEAADKPPDAGLVDLAKGLNPTIGFYDPLNFAEADFWGEGDEATIGFLRHAEVSWCWHLALISKHQAIS